MNDFDSIKDLWQQAAPVHKTVVARPVSRQAKDTKRKLLRLQLAGIIAMLTTAVFITWLIFFSGLRFQWATTMVGVVMMLLVLLLQAVVMYYMHSTLTKIDDTQQPKQHLLQWENYYSYRQKLLRWNKPAYFVCLNLAMGLYFLEILHDRPLQNIVIFIGIYSAWMIFAYFVLGRRAIRKENYRLQQIINELQGLEAQLNKVEN